MGEFDRLPEAERELWLERWRLKGSTCPDCGGPLEECADPDRVWYPFRRICYAAMERASAEAAYQQLHEKLAWHDGTFTKWAENYSAAFPFPAMAGVTIGAALEDVTPHDAFTTKVSASPVPPADDLGLVGAVEVSEQAAEAGDGHDDGDGEGDAR